MAQSKNNSKGAVRRTIPLPMEMDNEIIQIVGTGYGAYAKFVRDSVRNELSRRNRDSFVLENKINEEKQELDRLKDGVREKEKIIDELEKRRQEKIRLNQEAQDVKIGVLALVGPSDPSINWQSWFESRMDALEKYGFSSVGEAISYINHPPAADVELVKAKVKINKTWLERWR